MRIFSLGYNIIDNIKREVIKMKVNYIENHNTTTLQLVEVGSVFRPINSQDLFIKLDRNAESEIFSGRFKVLWQNFIGGYIGEEFTDKEEFDMNHDYTQLILCADIVTGEIHFMYENIKVKVIKCELFVEGT